MDALALNLVQGNASPGGATGTDPAAALGSHPAAVDFAALLALGIDALAASATSPQALEEAHVDAERKDPAAPLEATELLAPIATLAFPQEATAPSDTAKQPAPVPGDAQPVSILARAQGETLSVGVTAIADQPATIAAASHDADATARPLAQPVESTLEAVRFAEQTLGGAESAPRAEGAVQSAAMAVVETRPQVSQPSALLEVAAPVSEPGFADALSRQVVWMVDKDAQIAELRINPPELGPVEVRLTLNGDEALAHFASPHAEVREAIESAVARLREAMAQAGIQLGEASISSESFADQAAHADRHGAREQFSEGRNVRDGPSTGSGSIARGQRGLVDTFA
jgi:flagellar hook-length control protein FliK